MRDGSTYLMIGKWSVILGDLVERYRLANLTFLPSNHKFEQSNRDLIYNFQQNLHHPKSTGTVYSVFGKREVNGSDQKHPDMQVSRNKPFAYSVCVSRR